MYSISINELHHVGSAAWDAWGPVGPGSTLGAPYRPRIATWVDPGRPVGGPIEPRSTLEGQLGGKNDPGRPIWTQNEPIWVEKVRFFMVFWYQNGWRNGCVDMLRAGRFSMVFSMWVSSTFRIALSSLLFAEHSWDIGFCRVGCVFAMLIDVSFDATSRRSSRSIRQSLSLTILMENRWKIDRKSPSNVVLHQIRPQDRSWERFCLHFTLLGVLLGASG